MSDEDKPITVSLADVQAYARKQLAEIPPTKYEVCPQAAYNIAGQPHGETRAVGISGLCTACAERLVAYSQAGVAEAKRIQMCEPCFDYTMIHPDDRTPTEQKWMSLVKYKKDD